MKLESGKCYQVDLKNGNIVKFKFLGNNPENQNEIIVLSDNVKKKLV